MKTVLYVKGSERMPSAQKFSGFSRGAQVHGWRVQGLTLPTIRAADLKRLLAFWKADGFVMDCGNYPTVPILQTPDRPPSVYLTCSPADDMIGFSVCEDLRATAEYAARELLQLEFKDYAFVHFPRTRYWSTERARHFSAAVRLNGGTCAEFASNDRATLLAWNNSLRRWLKTLPRPCGIFAANDEVSNQIRGICISEGFMVPDDIALIGVDNDESICTNTRPQLSSVLSDNEQMGFQAARLLAAQFQDPSTRPTQHAVAPLMIVRRESTRHDTCRDSQVLQAIGFIREEACSGIRARDVLPHLSGSRRTAEMRFREATGHSILEEIQRVRMDRARELLCDTSRPLNVIANLCGYSSESAFRKVYRACFGASPRQQTRQPLNDQAIHCTS